MAKQTTTAAKKKAAQSAAPPAPSADPIDQVASQLPQPTGPPVPKPTPHGLSSVGVMPVGLNMADSISQLADSGMASTLEQDYMASAVTPLEQGIMGKIVAKAKAAYGKIDATRRAVVNTAAATADFSIFQRTMDILDLIASLPRTEENWDRINGELFSLRQLIQSNPEKAMQMASALSLGIVAGQDAAVGRMAAATAQEMARDKAAIAAELKKRSGAPMTMAKNFFNTIDNLVMRDAGWTSFIHTFTTLPLGVTCLASAATDGFRKPGGLIPNIRGALTKFGMETLREDPSTDDMRTMYFGVEDPQTRRNNCVTLMATYVARCMVTRRFTTAQAVEDGTQLAKSIFLWVGIATALAVTFGSLAGIPVTIFGINAAQLLAAFLPRTEGVWTVAWTVGSVSWTYFAPFVINQLTRLLGDDAVRASRTFSTKVYPFLRVATVLMIAAQRSGILDAAAPIAEAAGVKSAFDAVSAVPGASIASSIASTIYDQSVADLKASGVIIEPGMTLQQRRLEWSLSQSNSAVRVGLTSVLAVYVIAKGDDKLWETLGRYRHAGPLLAGAIRLYENINSIKATFTDPFDQEMYKEKLKQAETVKLQTWFDNRCPAVIEPTTRKLYDACRKAMGDKFPVSKISDDGALTFVEFENVLSQKTYKFINGAVSIHLACAMGKLTGKSIIPPIGFTMEDAAAIDAANNYEDKATPTSVEIAVHNRGAPSDPLVQARVAGANVVTKFTGNPAAGHVVTGLSVAASGATAGVATNIFMTTLMNPATAYLYGPLLPAGVFIGCFGFSYIAHEQLMYSIYGEDNRPQLPAIGAVMTEIGEYIPAWEDITTGLARTFSTEEAPVIFLQRIDRDVALPPTPEHPALTPKPEPVNNSLMLNYSFVSNSTNASANAEPSGMAMAWSKLLSLVTTGGGLWKPLPVAVVDLNVSLAVTANISEDVGPNDTAMIATAFAFAAEANESRKKASVLGTSEGQITAAVPFDTYYMQRAVTPRTILCHWVRGAVSGFSFSMSGFNCEAGVRMFKNGTADHALDLLIQDNVVSNLCCCMDGAAYMMRSLMMKDYQRYETAKKVQMPTPQALFAGPDVRQFHVDKDASAPPPSVIGGTAWVPTVEGPAVPLVLVPAAVQQIQPGDEDRAFVAATELPEQLAETKGPESLIAHAAAMQFATQAAFTIADTKVQNERAANNSTGSWVPVPVADFVASVTALVGSIVRSGEMTPLQMNDTTPEFQPVMELLKNSNSTLFAEISERAKSSANETSVPELAQKAADLIGYTVNALAAFTFGAVSAAAQTPEQVGILLHKLTLVFPGIPALEQLEKLTPNVFNATFTYPPLPTAEKEARAALMCVISLTAAFGHGVGAVIDWSKTTVDAILSDENIGIWNVFWAKSAEQTRLVADYIGAGALHGVIYVSQSVADRIRRRPMTDTARLTSSITLATIVSGVLTKLWLWYARHRLPRQPAPPPAPLLIGMRPIIIRRASSDDDDAADAGAAPDDDDNGALVAVAPQRVDGGELFRQSAQRRVFFPPRAVPIPRRSGPSIHIPDLAQQLARHQSIHIPDLDQQLARLLLGVGANDQPVINAVESASQQLAICFPLPQANETIAEAAAVGKEMRTVGTMTTVIEDPEAEEDEPAAAAASGGAAAAQSAPPAEPDRLTPAEQEVALGIARVGLAELIASTDNLPAAILPSRAMRGFLIEYRDESGMVAPGRANPRFLVNPPRAEGWLGSYTPVIFIRSIYYVFDDDPDVQDPLYTAPPIVKGAIDLARIATQLWNHPCEIYDAMGMLFADYPVYREEQRVHEVAIQLNVPSDAFPGTMSATELMNFYKNAILKVVAAIANPNNFGPTATMRAYRRPHTQNTFMVYAGGGADGQYYVQPGGDAGMTWSWQNWSHPR